MPRLAQARNWGRSVGRGKMGVLWSGNLVLDERETLFIDQGVLTS